MSRTILPHQLPQALDHRPGIAMLSLDCFDTLLWRDCHAPADLFGLLAPVTATQRRRAEQAARKARVLARHSSSEVSLTEIYATLMPHADAATRDAAMEVEVAAEARHCHAFAPTVALMREARRRGLPVVVVSDTYFEEAQLRTLIRTAAGDDVAALIDRIYCSCDHRSAKGERLFERVLADTALMPEQVLHIGDNLQADLHGAERYRIAALHLVQFGDTAVQRLRQEAAAGAMLIPGGVAFQPHRAAIAVAEPALADPGEALGFATLGPVLATFARWIEAEAQAVATARGGAVHLLFLLRDGHLPREVFGATVPDRTSHAVEISRFTATAASLHDPAALRRFVLDEIGDGVGRDLLRQVMIEGQEAATLLSGLPRADRPRALADALSSPRWTGRITRRGRAFADRLLAHVRRAIDPAPGDTVMLVDLGYNGTVQNRIDGLLAAELGVHVAGRYLILSEQEPSGLDKRGLLGPDTLDAAALEAVTSSVAVLEQFCTVVQGSVIDYTADGVPIRAAAGIKGRQSEVRDAVQAGCVVYAQQASRHAIRRTEPGFAIHRSAAVATLARLLFLPLPHELTLMARFEHDSNLGGDEKVSLFDPDSAAEGLKRRGLFYLKGAKRMYLPAEVRGSGLPTSLALLTQKRFGLDLRYADFCDSEIALPVLVADGTDAFTDTIRATPTHEGWYVAAIPVGACRYTVGIQFGRLYDHLQIDSAAFVAVSAFLGDEAAARAHALPALPSVEGMEQVAPHLFRCDADAFLMVPPPAAAPPGVPMMLTVVFRPIAAREPAEVHAAPAALAGATA